ncbi:hypothetical protein GCK72_013003 [Caenorhabditis remanei]|uniref:Uncharacterized protein n=1 Tax=Caenorhabditis remanei TaxID=31234 RepID=A0A6A5GMH7_CAERE|nr:hypothetical protein GCK72_013003 [Caenorhabditis remanei]KAF1756550.1 hypothetical protein GCK72_013003 [Caenorhabditis remanei]
MDIFGISAGLLGMYLNGIYTAFFCFQDHLTSYIYILLGIFVITAYVPTRQDFFERKIVGSRVGLLHIIYCIIITFGICPTVHWVFLHGGFDSDHKWFPNVIVLYSLIAAAFMFYVTMVPERLWPEDYDYQEGEYDESSQGSDEKNNDDATDSEDDSAEDSEEDESSETDDSLPKEDVLQEPSETSHHYNDRRRIGGRAAPVWNTRQYQYYHLSVHYLINVFVKLRSEIDI